MLQQVLWQVRAGDVSSDSKGEVDLVGVGYGPIGSVEEASTTYSSPENS